MTRYWGLVLLVLLIRVDWMIKNFHDVALNQQIIYPFTIFCLSNVGPSAISSRLTLFLTCATPSQTKQSVQCYPQSNSLFVCKTHSSSFRITTLPEMYLQDIVLDETTSQPKVEVELQFSCGLNSSFLLQLCARLLSFFDLLPNKYW
jgi:hypothetical protein